MTCKPCNFVKRVICQWCLPAEIEDEPKNDDDIVLTPAVREVSHKSSNVASQLQGAARRIHAEIEKIENLAATMRGDK